MIIALLQFTYELAMLGLSNMQHLSPTYFLDCNQN